MVMMMMNHVDIDNHKNEDMGVMCNCINCASLNLPNNNALRLKILPHKKCMDYPYENFDLEDVFKPHI